MNFKTKQSSVC